MCYVLVSNSWLDSGGNSNIRKSACAGERHVFVILVNSTTPYSRYCYRENVGYLSTAVHEMFIVIIKANTIRAIIKLIV